MKETKDTHIVVNTWRVIGIILTLDFTLQALFYYNILTPPEGIAFYTFLIAYTIMHVLFAFISIGFPESFLISQTQIVRICQLYKIVKGQLKETEPEHWGIERIEQYINEVPNAVFEDGCS